MLARKCARAHYYRYTLRITRRRPFRKPLIGIILHEMIDAWIKAQTIDDYNNDPWKVLEFHEKKYADLFQEEREKYGDIPQLTSQIFEGYMRRWKDDGITYVGAELPIKTNLTDDIELVGKLDAIVMMPSGLRFLLERKFMTKLATAEDRFSDIQTLLYFWAWNREHRKEEQLDGVIWDYGRMKPPTVPEVLKSGELTRRKDIDTDAYTYLEAIKDNGLKPGDYVEQLNMLKGKETTFFERVPLPAPPKKMVETVVEDARITAIMRKQMGDIAPRDGMSMFNCKTCEFRSVCEAEVRGHDWEFVTKRDYKPREERDASGDEE